MEVQYEKGYSDLAEIQWESRNFNPTMAGTWILPARKEWTKRQVLPRVYIKSQTDGVSIFVLVKPKKEMSQDNTSFFPWKSVL